MRATGLITCATVLFLSTGCVRPGHGTFPLTDDALAAMGLTQTGPQAPSAGANGNDSNGPAIDVSRANSKFSPSTPSSTQASVGQAVVAPPGTERAADANATADDAMDRQISELIGPIDPVELAELKRDLATLPPSARVAFLKVYHHANERRAASSHTTPELPATQVAEQTPATDPWSQSTRLLRDHDAQVLNEVSRAPQLPGGREVEPNRFTPHDANPLRDNGQPVSSSEPDRYAANSVDRAPYEQPAHEQQRVYDSAVQQAAYTTSYEPGYEPSPREENPGPRFEGPGAAQRLDAVTTDTTSRDWRELLGQTIKALEHDIEEDRHPAEIDRAAALRLMYLVGNRRDDALDGNLPVNDDRSSPAEWERDFWRNELYGLSQLMYDHDQPGDAKRYALALSHLRNADARLAEGADLVVKNLAFIIRVNSFGNYDAVDEPYEFAPGEQVLLYAEVENFRSDENGDGYDTQLTSSFEIRDAQGRKVFDQEVEPHPDHCLTRRQDYFMGLKFRLPNERLYEETYTLVLTVEDTLAKKFAQASIPFRIKYAER